jgi:hypothetical protein
MHLIQVRQNAELKGHYHKYHDEVIYVKKGSGIATLDDTRYLIKPGSILQVPNKTVHKFLNTGDEVFIAVSIFSPSYDGRDIKFIKEKKKTARNIKEEKRLANSSTKETKGTDKNETSARKESSKKDIQPKKTDSESSDEDEELVKPPKKTDTKAERTPSSTEKLPTSNEKKKSKKSITTESSSVDIKELHEKLTRLMELKEDGTISEEEYEEKKDALVMGRNIGKLPEPKGSLKKKPSMEDISLPEADEQHSEDSDLYHDERDDVSADSSGTHQKEKSSSTMYRDADVEEGGADSSESAFRDKLIMLDEMRQEGLITENDYQRKKKELSGSMKQGEAFIASPEEITENEKIYELKELYNEGLISEEDYESKLRELKKGPARHNTSHVPDNSDADNEKLMELLELKEQGLISEEDYEFKKTQLLQK